MLLAGGSDPSEALNGLKNITIVSALPFVIVMLLLCVALWKDLCQDPLVIQRELATHLLDQSVATGVNEYDGGVFGLATSEFSQVPADEEGEEEADASRTRTGVGKGGDAPPPTGHDTDDPDAEADDRRS